MARRAPAACQPRRALGQRPRGDPHRTSCGRSRRNWCAATFWTATHIGLDYLRRQHQPRGRLGHRMPCMLKALLQALLEPIERCANWKRGRLHRAAGIVRGPEEFAVRRRVGLLLHDERRASQQRLVGRRAAIRAGRTQPTVEVRDFLFIRPQQKLAASLKLLAAAAPPCRVPDKSPDGPADCRTRSATPRRAGKSDRASVCTVGARSGSL